LLKGEKMALFRPAVALVLAALLAATLSACASKKDLRTAHDSGRYIREHNLRELPQFDIPIEVNERVVAWMEYFQGPGRKHFQRYMERSGRYVPMMTKILREMGMPRDLVYIALIESGFNTSAYSRAAAVGPWQFISATGRRYGLKNDGWVDERRDPIKSTYAAAQYFKELHGEFGDWYLAMAGYNGGEGRVRNAIEMTGSRNFWEIAEDGRAFRAETRDYVPKFIAAAIMAKAPERFGFTDVAYQPPLDFETARVESQTDVPVIARCAGVDEQAVYDLNPHLVRGATPPNERNYEVRLPRGTSLKFKEQYAMLPKEERIQVVRYEARPGDTIVKIARRFGVGASQLAEANGVSVREKLHRGDKIMIPAGAAARFASAMSQDNGGGKDSHDGRYSSKHRVRKGDSLQSIADSHGVTVVQLRKWNDIGRKSKIQRGQVLKIYKENRRGADVASDDRPGKSERAGRSASYVVKKGDTLGGIAAKNGVTTKQLMAWNNLTNPKGVKAGQKLVIRGEAYAEPKSNAIASRTTAVPLDGSAPSNSEGKAAKVAESRETKIVKSESHKVRKGDTLGAIAAKYGVTTKQLMAWNDLKNAKGLKAGQTLVVKKTTVQTKGKTSASVEPMPSGQGARDTNGGTPIKIDGLGGVKAAPRPQEAPAAVELPDVASPQATAPAGTPIKLAQADNGSESVRRADAPVGTPVKLAAAHPATDRASQQAVTTYRVKSGETLWEIARRHKVTIAQLQKWNNLSDPSSVKPGTTLKIMKD